MNTTAILSDILYSGADDAVREYLAFVKKVHTILMSVGYTINAIEDS